MAQEGDLLTVDEVAARLRVTGESVRRWLRPGKIHGIKVSDTWRIERKELERYLDERRG